MTTLLQRRNAARKARASQRAAKIARLNSVPPDPPKDTSGGHTGAARLDTRGGSGAFRADRGDERGRS